MSYYRLLHLKKEPFSTSPDPSFFYLSRFHRAALFRVRIGIELKRGLSMVVGDIGTGKTTLARRLSKIFYQDPRVDFQVILNPMEEDENDFLAHLLTTFKIEHQPTRRESLCALEHYLYHQGVEEEKTVVLLIDEAQQLSLPSLEILRILLNYETNDFKLLQVVLMGQMELVARVKAVENFWDRISLKVRIPPLDECATREMIEYRLQQAGYSGRKPLFAPNALKMIYRETQGLPRKITLLCHDALEGLVMTGQDQVTPSVIREIRSHEYELLQAVGVR